jgi:hypothetical protein
MGLARGDPGGHSFAQPGCKCGRRDSNPHGLPHWNLNPARLPVPPRPQAATVAKCSCGIVGRMNTAMGTGLLWAQRIGRLLLAALCIVAAAVLAVWLLVVDWQILFG